MLILIPLNARFLARFSLDWLGSPTAKMVAGRHQKVLTLKTQHRSLRAKTPENLQKPNRKGSSSSPTISQGRAVKLREWQGNCCKVEIGSLFFWMQRLNLVRIFNTTAQVPEKKNSILSKNLANTTHLLFSHMFFWKMYHKTSKFDHESFNIRVNVGNVGNIPPVQ